MTRILVVEDDAPLRDAVATSLRAHGYAATEAGTAEEAIALAGHDLPDLVLLDLSLPGADGFHALERLRTFTEIPVVVLTVRDAKDDKIRALDGGADDYVVKPFDLDELLARLRAALRRRPDGEAAETVIAVGDLEIDRARGRVTRGGDPVHLTPTELRLLDLLVTSDGRLLTYAQVTAHLHTLTRRDVDQGTLRVFVAQLRKKLGDDAADPRLIVTHHGLGYRWIAGDSPDDQSL
ncbi:MAG TPA: response regulator transcription factor [Acidimicrobiia bacterium]